MVSYCLHPSIPCLLRWVNFWDLAIDSPTGDYDILHQLKFAVIILWLILKNAVETCTKPSTAFTFYSWPLNNMGFELHRSTMWGFCLVFFVILRRLHTHLGLELTTLISRVVRSINWASQMPTKLQFMFSLMNWGQETGTQWKHTNMTDLLIIGFQIQKPKTQLSISSCVILCTTILIVTFIHSINVAEFLSARL